VFRWADKSISGKNQIVKALTTKIRQEFPATHPAPPEIDLSNQSMGWELGRLFVAKTQETYLNSAMPLIQLSRIFDGCQKQDNCQGNGRS
jgi:hypothetical protein